MKKPNKETIEALKRGHDCMLIVLEQLRDDGNEDSPSARQCAKDYDTIRTFLRSLS